MTAREDLLSASRFVSFAARPKDRPTRNAAYADLVKRYREDESFADLCEIVAAGLGIEIHTVDAEVGLIASAASDSPLRAPLSLFPLKTSTGRKALSGVVLLSIAHAAFPVRSHLEDPARVAYVDEEVVVATLNRLSERALEARPDDIDADQPQLVETWREWLALREARHDQRRASAGDRLGVVHKTCSYLESQGHLQAPTSGGQWRATPRFRIAVRGIVNDSEWYGRLIALLNDEGAGDDPESPYDAEDADDPIGAEQAEVHA